MTILVTDVGTSGVRAVAFSDDATVLAEQHREVLPHSPAGGLVEFDPVEMADAVLEVTRAVASGVDGVDAVGIAAQRASTVVWDRSTGEPVGPGIGWQDLRTVGTCLELRERGVRLAPNASATKAQFLWDQADPGRSRDLCVGTVDSWVAWTLSEGADHITDATNAALTGMRTAAADGWDEAVTETLSIPVASLPTVVDSSGPAGTATALPGHPPITGIAGDQQASLIGQGCVRPGLAKITFGTGGMLDLCVGADRPRFAIRGGAGTFPIVAWARHGSLTWGVEAVMLAAGTNVEWLRDDLGLIASAAESHEVASACDDTGGVVYVPAPLGLGAPQWDYGARGTLLGITRGTGRAEVTRAVLEGIAHRGADLVEAAEADTGISIKQLRVDGGMSANPTFLAALADATQRPIEVAPMLEATARGAAYLAGMATGAWADEDEIANAWSPRAVVEPTRTLDRDRWAEACRRAGGWLPDLSALEF